MAVEVSEVSQDLTPAETRHLRSLEGRISKGLRTFREIGAALLEIRDSKLYRAEFQTFEAYCTSRWGLARDRAYQLMGAAEVVKVLGSDADGLVHESQARELVAVMHADPKAVSEVWAEVKATGKPVTAEVIREVVKTRTPEADPGPTMTQALVTRILGVAAAYKKWDASKPTRKERAAVTGALDKLEESTGG